MESNSSLIKSNKLSHLPELDLDKTKDDPFWNKISIGINCNVPQFFKPKMININIKSTNTKKIIIFPNEKPFTNKTLKLIFKNDIPNVPKRRINLKNSKLIQSPKKNKFKGNLNWLIKSLSSQKFEENKIFKDDIRDNFLPKILKMNQNIKKRKMNSRNYIKPLKMSLSKSASGKDLRITSGMLNSKRLYKERDDKLSINSFMIKSHKNISISDEEKDNKSFLSDNKNINSRNNISNKINANKYFIKKYTKTGMLNNIFKKYPNSNYSHNKSSFSENANHNSLSDNSIAQRDYTFLTKIKDEYISHLSQRYNNIISNIKKNNTQIININKQINVNCLLSKVNENLKREQLFLDINKKTLYELEKESSYRRVKKFEDFINKLYKEKT